jgi:hypothetical protein
MFLGIILFYYLILYVYAYNRDFKDLPQNLEMECHRQGLCRRVIHPED